MKSFNKGNWKLIFTLLTFLAFIGLVIALRHQIIETFKNLSEVNAWILLLMVVWQSLSYYSYARMYRQLFLLLGEKIRFRSLLRVTIELNFINNILPSGGVSGISYFSLRMRDADVNPSKSAVVQVGRFILIFLSFEILLLFGLFMLAIVGNVNNLTMLIGGSAATVLVIATFGLAFIVSSKKRINTFFTFTTKQINRAIHFFRPNRPEAINIDKVRETFTGMHDNYQLLKENPDALKKPLTWALLVNAAEVLTVYTVYAAFGYWVNPGAVIIAYAVANFAGIISVLPGGVGIYEALMTATLAATGISPAISIPVTIMYRVLNMGLQLPAGYYFYHKALNQQQTNEN